MEGFDKIVSNRSWSCRLKSKLDIGKAKESRHCRMSPVKGKRYRGNSVSMSAGEILNSGGNTDEYSP